MNCLSFDVGGTTVKYGVIDESYKILKKDKIPTPENENDFIYSLSNIIQENLSIISKVSVAMPGYVNSANNKYLYGPHLKYDIDFSQTHSQTSKSKIALQTLAFTFLNPHVYSDTVFILGNLSKNFALQEKFYFAFGASFASIIFFYSLGYMSSMFANFIQKKNTWKYINSFIVSFMSILVVYIAYDTLIHILIAIRV